jgi:hypothetical protein
MRQEAQALEEVSAVAQPAVVVATAALQVHLVVGAAAVQVVQVQMVPYHLAAPVVQEELYHFLLLVREQTLHTA